RGTLNASSTQSKAKVQGGGVDPEDFMRHLNNSVQIARGLGIEYDVRQQLTQQSSGGFAEVAPRADMPAAAQAFSISSSPAPSIASNGLPVYTVATNIEHEGWARAMSQQVLSFIRRGDGEQIAQLRLDPPELGPIRVSISLSDGVAHAAFGAASAHVRQALEQALPELSRAMSEAGISLGQADVNEGEAHASGFADAGKPGNGSASGSQGKDQTSEESVEVITHSDTRRPHDGLVNTFA